MEPSMYPLVSVASAVAASASNLFYPSRLSSTTTNNASNNNHNNSNSSNNDDSNTLGEGGGNIYHHHQHHPSHHQHHPAHHRQLHQQLVHHQSTQANNSVKNTSSTNTNNTKNHRLIIDTNHHHSSIVVNSGGSAEGVVSAGAVSSARENGNELSPSVNLIYRSESANSTVADENASRQQQQQQPNDASNNSDLSLSSNSSHNSIFSPNQFKEVVYALLFEKCELATCTPRENGVTSDVCSVESFSDDVARFVETLRANKVFYVPNPEIDTLIIQAIQSFRYQLIQLEKLHHITQDFCQRHLNRLKKQTSIDLVLEETKSENGSPDNRNSPHQAKESKNTSNFASSNASKPYQINNNSNLHASYSHHASRQDSPTDSINGHRINTFGSYQQRSTPETNAHLHNNVNAHHNNSQIIETGSEPENSLGSECGDDEYDDDNKKRAKKRGIFPKAATSIMKTWLFNNITHPYPSEDQKKQLAQDTGLTILQVNNWFINARRRIVQPIIDKSNRDVFTYNPEANFIGFYGNPTANSLHLRPPPPLQSISNPPPMGLPYPSPHHHHHQHPHNPMNQFHPHHVQHPHHQPQVNNPMFLPHHHHMMMAAAAASHNPIANSAAALIHHQNHHHHHQLHHHDIKNE